MTLISNIKSYKQLLQKCPLFAYSLVVIYLLTSCGSGDDLNSDLQSRYKDDLKAANDKVALDSNNVQAWFERGNANVDKKEYLSAIVSFDKAISLNPEFVDAWFNRGESLLRLNQLEEALDCYDTIVKIAPQHVRAWVKRGTILDSLKQYELAVSCYDTALTYEDNDYIWFKHFCALNALEDETVEDGTSYKKYLRETALRSIKRSSEMQELQIRARKWISTGDSLELESKYEEALAAYDRALSIETNHIVAFSSKGKLLTEKSRHKEALICFDNVIAAYEDKHWIYFMEGSDYHWFYLSNALENRAGLFVELNRKEDAIKDLKVALSIIPKDKSGEDSRSRVENNLKTLMLES